MSWLDALGWAGSALLVYSLLQARVLRFRVLNTVGCVVLIVFNALLGVWPMVGMNLVLAGINLWFIRTLLRDRHDLSAYAVLEVGLTDAYLRHFLTVHDEDIRTLLPRRRVDRARGGAQRLPGRPRRRDRRRGRRPRQRAKGSRRSSSTTSPRGSATSRRASSSTGAAGSSGSGDSRRWSRRTEMVSPYYDSVGFRREGDRQVLDVSQV